MMITREEMARVKREGEVHDPFTRRKTAPSIVPRKKKELIVGSDIFTEDKETSAKDSKEKENDDDKKENKPMDDMFSAHNFDIAIDLDVATPNNATNVSLKPVVHAKKDNGPKKSLNLADYKKKRGLI